MAEFYIDADSCPVKDEIYRVAYRYGLVVHVVANQSHRVPDNEAFRTVLVSDLFDAADDWIAEHAGPGDIVITGDILLAARCLELGCKVVGPRGRVFKDTTIGDALAAREAQAYLREMGVQGGGPPPFQDRDRSRFLQRLDELVQAVQREQP
ncbi:MAG: hypothetical protein ACI9EF_003201 [Pseudohongiellaceae bacterium]